ncbi:MAG: CBS domain-containing protein [Spirochaetales bacterium]|nr:CBS domain-containing protein [Spirochaetales bacterium]
MNVRDLLAKKGNQVVTIKSSSSILEAVQLMNKKHIGALIVQAGKTEVAGIVTERDVLKHIENFTLKDSISSIMTPAERMLVVSEDDSVEYALNVFTNNKIRHLPVYKGNSLSGIISIGDAVKGNLSEMQTENKLLQDYITGTYPVYS